MADRRNQNLLCLPDLSVGQAHKDSLRKIAVFFSENVDPAYMVGFLFHFHPQSDIGMRRQVQRFQSDFRIDGKTVQVMPSLFTENVFRRPYWVLPLHQEAGVRRPRRLPKSPGEW